MLVTSVCIANKVTCKCVYVYCAVCPSCSLQRRGVWSRGREGRRRQHPGQVLRVLQRFLLQHRGKWLPHSSVSLSLEHNDLVYSTQWWALDRRNLRWVSCWCLSSSAHVRMRLGYVPLTPPLLLFLTSPLSSRAPSVRTPFYFTLSAIMWGFYTSLLCYVCTYCVKGVYWCSCRLAVCTDIQALQC